jgi:hypothetical protein
MKRFAILAAGVIAVAQVTAVQAQTANIRSISIACSGAATSCAAVVRAEIEALRTAGLTGTAYDAQLGQIAVAIQQGGANATLAGRAIAVSMMREVAAEVSDPAQAAAISQAALNLEAGVVSPIPVIAPQDASPN